MGAGVGEDRHRRQMPMRRIRLAAVGVGSSCEGKEGEHFSPSFSMAAMTAAQREATRGMWADGRVGSVVEGRGVS